MALAKTTDCKLLLVVPAEKFRGAAAAVAALIERLRPAELNVIDADMLAPLNVVAVPPYPEAFRLNPALFTVHVTFVWAVLRPIASVLARAVVIALWLAVIEALLNPKLIPFALLNPIELWLLEVVPAEKLTLLNVTALLSIAVVR